MYGVEEPDDPSIEDQNWTTAVQSILAVRDTWRMQLELVLRHPVELKLDFASLHYTYERIQPFVHQAIAGTLGAISLLAFDSRLHDRIAVTRKVIITVPPAGQSTSALLQDGTLTVAVKLVPNRETPLAQFEITDAIRVALGEAPSTETPPPETEEPIETELSYQAPPPPPVAPARGKKNVARETGDIYAQANALISRLEQVMRQENLWPGDKPPGEIEVRGAFGSENLAFTQWLAWILVERIREIIQDHGTFPSQSQVSAYARREFDGVPGGDAVADVLMDLDDLVNRNG